MTTDMQPPMEVYQTVAADQARRWEYTETLDVDQLAAYIRRQADDPNLRADVEAVWRYAVTTERRRVTAWLTAKANKLDANGLQPNHHAGIVHELAQIVRAGLDLEVETVRMQREADEAERESHVRFEYGGTTKEAT